MTDWNGLAEEIHALAVEKGWWDGPTRHCEELGVLVATEFAEAVEAYRERGFSAWTEDNGKPCGFASEIADAAIRCLDWISVYGPMWEHGKRQFLNGAALRCTFWERLADAIEHSCAVAPSPWRVLGTCQAIAKAHEIDLVAEIERKHEYNRTRPHRHGGKLA
jgi:hypothetical protein